MLQHLPTPKERTPWHNANPNWSGPRSSRLHVAGMTLTELARRSDVPVGSMTRVKGQTHYKAQAAIAEFIGEKAEDLWPDRYPMGPKPRILDTNKFPPVASAKGRSGNDKAKAA